MKNISLIYLLLLLFLASFMTACEQGQSTLKLDKKLTAEQEVIITLGEHKVYKNEFTSYVKSRTQQELEQLNPEAQENLFQEFVQLELLSQKSVISKLDKTEEFILESHNLKKNLLAQALLKKFEKNNLISDIDIAAQYEIAKAEFEIPQLKVKHILLNTAEEAQAVIELLKINKSDFAELAKEKSISPSGQNGGDMNWFYAVQMLPAFSDAASKLEKGSFSKVPVETPDGFHVLLKEDQRLGSAPPLENLRPRLEQKIKQNRLEKYIADIRLELQIQENFTPIKK